MLSGVYQILNTVNGKRYIGRTKCFNKRWCQHRHLLKNNNHGNVHLQRAYNKYGVDKFEYSIIELTERLEDLPALETLHINKAESGTLYNLNSSKKFSSYKHECAELKTLTYKDLTKSIEDWAQYIGISCKDLLKLLSEGDTIESILNDPAYLEYNTLLRPFEYGFTGRDEFWEFYYMKTCGQLRTNYLGRKE